MVSFDTSHLKYTPYSCTEMCQLICINGHVECQFCSREEIKLFFALSHGMIFIGNFHKLWLVSYFFLDVISQNN